MVIEKRDRISRNNVLHLWPFVIQDLRMLGAKKFFGKFCAGSIDHISEFCLFAWIKLKLNLQNEKVDYCASICVMDFRFIRKKKKKHE